MYYANATPAARDTCSSLGRTPVYRTNCSSPCKTTTCPPLIVVFPASCAARTRGVSIGSATTSNTIPAAVIISGGNDKDIASGPPVIPSGVTLTRRAPVKSVLERLGRSGTHRKPQAAASACPLTWLRATGSPFQNPLSRKADATAFPIPPLPRRITDKFVGISYWSMRRWMAKLVRVIAVKPAFVVDNRVH
jgi:hypothetical protein